MDGETYLRDHNISEQFALDYGIAWDDNYLNIPIKDAEGNLLFIKTRNLHHGENSDPKYKNPIGSTVALFNWHLAKDSPNIALTEGEMDTLKLTEENIPAVSSTGGANTFKPEWVELLKGKNIWICYDNDTAGKEATRSLLDLLPSAIVIQLPENIKDISDFFVAGGSKKDFLKLNQYNASEWIKLNRPETFDLITAGDIETMEVPEFSWIIDGIIYAQGFAFLYGAEGTGKSYIVMDMAKSIALGTPWLDKFNTNQAKILFLDKENPTPMIKKRLSGLGMTREQMGDCIDNLHWLKFPHEFQLTNQNGEASEFAHALSEIVIEEEIDLIIIDSFVDLVVGNENSSGDTQAFFNALKQLYPNIAYLVIHHENKPTQGVARSASQRLRGSTNISAQALTMFRVEQVANSKTEMTLQQTKARDTMKIDKFMVRMNVASLKDGTTTVSAFEYLGEISNEIDDSKSGEIREAIKEIINQKNYITRKNAIELGKEQGASERTILRAIDGLLESGEIAKDKKGREVVYITDMFSNKRDIEAIIEEFGDELL